MMLPMPKRYEPTIRWEDTDDPGMCLLTVSVNGHDLESKRFRSTSVLSWNDAMVWAQGVLRRRA